MLVLFARILVPGDVLAQLAGDEQVEVAVEIDIDGANVVGRLIGGDEVVGKSSAAVVFKPPGLLVAVGAGGGVQIAVAIHIDDDERVRLLQCFVDGVLAPHGGLEPDHTVAVAARGDEIGLAVAVDIGGLNVCRSNLAFGDQSFGPGFVGSRGASHQANHSPLFGSAWGPPLAPSEISGRPSPFTSPTPK